MEINTIEITRFVRIDWSRYFDRIYGLHYLPNVERKKEMDAELAFVGMDSSPIFQWHYTYPTVFDSYIRNRMTCNSSQFSLSDRQNTITSVILAYYNIFHESLSRGFKKILVIEDDCSFIRETCFIRDILNHLPEDWDYIHFDKMLSQFERYRLAFCRSANPYFMHYYGGFWGTALTAYSENAMRAGIAILERNLTASDSLLENNDEPEPNTLHRYIPISTICLQRDRPLSYTVDPV